MFFEALAKTIFEKKEILIFAATKKSSFWKNRFLPKKASRSCFFNF